jgi:hypothetical protein
MSELMVKALVIAAVLALVVALSAFGSWLMWLIWQSVIVPVFHAPALTFVQMWGLMIFVGGVGGLFRSCSGSKS